MRLRLVASVGAVAVLLLVASAATAGPGASFTFYTGAHINMPFGITAGPDGALWFTNDNGSSIGRITTAGVASDYTGAGISRPQGITLGSDGALWFTNYIPASIGRITTTGVVTIFTDSRITFPMGITSGPDGALWFTNTGNNTIGRISTSGAVTSYADPTIGEPLDITRGADGALWFTNFANDSIGRITTSGGISNYKDVGIQMPLGITAGPDGALWFNTEGHSIGRITTGGGVSTYPDATGGRITTGLDGALWFTSGNAIGRITTSGVISNYADPGISVPGGITSGPDGALWFTNSGNNTIGRLALTPKPPICSYDPATRELGVQAPNGPLATVIPTVLRVAPGGLILLNGVWCGATVTTTDTIHVTSPGAAESAFRLVIDLRGGPFAPGATDEPGTSDEIEINVDMAGTFLSRIVVIGSDEADHIVAGTDGAFPAGTPSINLNAAEPTADADVQILTTSPIAEIPAIELYGGAGDDVLSLAGGEGTGSYAYPAIGYLFGGPGNDVLRGGHEWASLDGGDGNDILMAGPSGDTLEGGPGNDQLVGNGGNDTIFASSDGAVDSVVCGTGADTVTADTDDEIGSDCEYVTRVGGTGGGGGGGGSGAADLYLTGSAEPTSVPVGGTLTWRLRVLDDKNYGPATGVYVDVTLPAGVQVVSATADRGQGCVSSGPGTLRCNLDWLSSDAPYANIVVVTNVTQAGELVLTATVGYAQADSDPSNNTLTLKANIPAVAPAPPKPPAVVVKPVLGKALAQPAQPLAGKRFTFTLPVNRSDTNAPLTTARMVCDPSVAGKVIRHVESFKAGKARLSLLVPKTARGKQLRITIKITIGAQSATKIATYKVR
jgi:virginiamycin B lyase